MSGTQTAQAQAPIDRISLSLASIHAGSVLALGYALLGWVPTLLFALGFIGGLLLWNLIPSTATFTDIRVPYLLALLLFIAHKVEERHFDFFPALAKLTGEPIPQPGSLLGAMLYALASAWLLVPVLMSRGKPIGHYLAWSFFASMGITELAHLAFPLCVQGPMQYFPGMATVFILAPVAWWGLARMTRGQETRRSAS